MATKYRFRKKGQSVQLWTFNEEELTTPIKLKTLNVDAVIKQLDNNGVVQIRDSNNEVNVQYRDVLHPTASSAIEMVNQLNGFFAPENSGMVAFGKFMVDDTGNKEAKGDYSNEPKEFVFNANQFGPYASIEVSSILATVKDSGSIDSGKYGNGLKLKVGIDIHLVLRGREFTIMDGELIKTITDYANHGFILDLHNFGSGVELFSAKADMLELFHKPLRLYAESGDQIKVILKDNFSGLESHMFKILGSYI